MQISQEEIKDRLRVVFYTPEFFVTQKGAMMPYNWTLQADVPP